MCAARTPRHIQSPYTDTRSSSKSDLQRWRNGRSRERPLFLFIFLQRQAEVVVHISYSYFSPWCRIGIWENLKKVPKNAGGKRMCKKRFLRHLLSREHWQLPPLRQTYFKYFPILWESSGISLHFKRALRRAVSPSRAMCVLSKKMARSAWKLQRLVGARLHWRVRRSHSRRNEANGGISDGDLSCSTFPNTADATAIIYAKPCVHADFSD